MKIAPANLEEAAETFSNFDHAPPSKEIENQVREGTVKLEHPAWDHHGWIWFEDGQFHEEIWRYRAHVETMSGDTLKDVFKAVNERYGIG